MAKDKGFRMNKDPIKCDDCGKFIAYADFENGAECHMITPDTEVSSECYSTLCKKCNKPKDSE